MAVRQVNEYDPQADTERLRLVPPTDPPSTVIDQDQLRLQTISVLHGFARILGARLILLLSVLIGGGLAAVATWKGSVGAIVAASLFDFLVVIPIALLAARKG